MINMNTKITQQNINNVHDCLMRTCHTNGHDFTKHLGHDAEWSFVFDVCNKKGKVICYPMDVPEIEEVLEANGFEITSQVSECPSNTNFKIFIFTAKKTDDDIDPEIKTFLDENDVEILKQENGYIEVRPTTYLLTDKITKLMYKHYYERTRREYVDKVTTLGFTKITGPVEKLFCKIDNEAQDNFKREINYVDIDDYDDEELILCFSTTGGYEADVNAYWGGDEYVDDFVGTLEGYDEITDVRYDLDEEDLSGYIFIKYDAAKI